MNRPFTWASLVGLALLYGGVARAEEPPRLGLPSAKPLPVPAVDDSQRLADAIASHLRQSGQLRHYRIDVAVHGGDVELTGSVVDQTQREEVLRLVQGVPGVVCVIDHITLTVGNPIVRAQAEGEGADLPRKLPPPAGDKGRLPAPLPDHSGAPAPATGPEGDRRAIAEPAPVFRTPIAGNLSLNPPRMPPYAWPSYAPYNNFSRVAEPKAYPYNAWPFIGPPYPFPKIPVGWRKIKLEWDDGYWWYGRVGTPCDWWKIRYW
jgi:hypothetical protein